MGNFKNGISEHSISNRDPEKRNAIRQRYRNALDSFVERIRKDRYVIAVMLCGSLSYDEVWERSDLDIIVVTSDESRPYQQMILTEHDIIIDTYIYSRSHFKKSLDRALQGGITNSFFSKSTLLFSKDET
ncbi:MAG: hypothetical protein ACFFBD_29135, partial [Candidatus Hodarchaeota archaeon]